MPDYGKLSGRPLDEMIAGARIEVAPYKRDPMDFVLWKPSKPGEPAWRSPARIKAPGRPGWHIECSAMADKWLWARARSKLSRFGRAHPHQFDIHGGGIDLVFPHHEDEIAQTRCAFHTPVMANYWIHNGFLEIDGRKMSKSEGNFLTIRELLVEKKFGDRNWSGDVIRFAMLQAPYRHPIDWTLRILQQSESRLRHWRAFAAQRTVSKHNDSLQQEFMRLLGDDLDTPAAFNLIDRVCNNESAAEPDRYTVHWVLRLLGFKSSMTPAAKVVEAISPVVSKVSNMTDADWQNLVTTIGRKSKGTAETERSTSRFLASLGALGELPELLRNYQVSDIRTEPLDALQRLQDSSPYSQRFHTIQNWIRPTNYRRIRFRSKDRETFLNSIRLQRSIDSLSSAIGSLSRLTVNDWNNLIDSARRGPFFSSGEPKPETKLLLYLWILSRLQDRIAHELKLSKRENHLSKVLGQLIADVRPSTPTLEEKIRDLVELRNNARRIRDFKESDRIRDELAKMGVVLKDSKDGTTWEIAR
jgi:cysteinyl-tRNA synthetase